MTNQNTSQTAAIRADATLLIQQDCGGCHGTGETADGAICVTCWGTRRVTLHVTLRELSEALGRMLPTVARHATGTRLL
jgi:DnaJ-class molecular chaperone